MVLAVMVADVLALLEAEVLTAMVSRALAQAIVVLAPAEQAVAKAKERVRFPKSRP